MAATYQPMAPEHVAYWRPNRYDDAGAWWNDQATAERMAHLIERGEEDGWRYDVVAIDQGYRIAVSDDTGEMVGWLGAKA